MFRPISMGALTLMTTGLAACGSGSDPQYDDVATGIAAMFADPDAGEPRGFFDTVTVARDGAVPGLSLTAAGVVTGQRGQLTIKYELKCKDSADAIVSTCSGAASADFKSEWKGQIDAARYKLSIDRKAEWKIRDFNGVTASINGHGSYHVQSDFKEQAGDLRHKYDFDFDVQYHDVTVRVSDGMLMGGRADFDLDAKEKSEDGSQTIKSQLKIKTTVTFEEGNEVVVDLDAKYKYRIELDSGDVHFEGRID